MRNATILVFSLTALSPTLAAEADRLRIDLPLVEARSADNLQAYASFGKIPKADYVTWRAAKVRLGSRDFDFEKQTKLLEILVLVENTAAEPVKLFQDEIALKHNGKQVKPWELVSPGFSKRFFQNRPVFDASRSMFRIYHLTGAGAECTLAQGERTYLILLFFVPHDLKEATLFLTKKHEQKLKLQE